MKLFLQIFGVFFIIAGISLFIYPAFIFDYVFGNLDSQLLYFSAIISRLFLGTILLLTASQSRFPKLFKIFGVISFIAAVVFLFLGNQGFTDLLTSLLPALKPYSWVSGILSISLGVFLIYALFENKTKGA